MQSYMVWLIDKDGIQTQVACSAEDLSKFLTNLDGGLYAVAYVEGARLFSGNYLDYCTQNKQLECGIEPQTEKTGDK